MAVDTQTPAAVAPANGRKKKQPSAAKRTTPSVADLIVEIVSASNEKGGVSLAALKKALAPKGYDVAKNNARVKMALKNLVMRAVLVQVKGTGASGSFKLNKKKTEAKKAAKSDATKATKSTARKRAPKPKDKKQSTKEKKSTAAKVTVKSKKDKKAGNRKNIEKPVKTSKPTKPGKSRSVKPKTVQVKSAKGRKTGPNKK